MYKTERSSARDTRRGTDTPDRLPPRAHVQLKRTLAGMPYEEQLKVVRPPRGLAFESTESDTAGPEGRDAAVQLQADGADTTTPSVNREQVRAALVANNFGELLVSLRDHNASDWPTEITDRMETGRAALTAVVTEARTAGAMADLIAQNCYTYTPNDVTGHRAIAARFLRYALAVADEARELTEHDISCVFLGGHSDHLRAIAHHFTQIAEGATSISGQTGTKSFCQAFIRALNGLLYHQRELSPDFAIGLHMYEEAEVIKAWAQSLIELIDELNSIPWYMWIPLVNIVGLAFYAPMRRGVSYAADQFVSVVAEHSVELAGPIIIPVLAAWQIALEPHKVISIVQGKIDIIRTIADQSTSQEDRWNALFNYATDRVVDIAIAKIGSVSLSAPSGPAGLGAWVMQNRDALARKILADVLGGLAKDAKKAILEGRSPLEALRHVPAHLLKSSLKALIGDGLLEQTGGGPVIDDLVKELLGYPIDQAVDALPGG